MRWEMRLKFMKETLTIRGFLCFLCRQQQQLLFYLRGRYVSKSARNKNYPARMDKRAKSGVWES
jgi:hypothetical protein